jgi:hypothetical protein
VAKVETRWDALHERAFGTARRLTFVLKKDELPIPLSQLANQQRVRVFFQPLFVEGGLAVDEAGFVVYLNVSSRRASELQEAYGKVPESERLLNVRERFTLAHELAHTMFFEFSPDGGKPRPLVGAHPKEREKLEFECDALAGYLLMPDHHMESVVKLKCPDLLNPTTIRELAGQFHVSVDCLVIRFRPRITGFDAPGGVVLAPRNGPISEKCVRAFTNKAYELFEPQRVLNLSAITLCRDAVSTVLKPTEVQIPRRYGSQRVHVTAIPVSETNDERLIIGLRLVDEITEPDLLSEVPS